MKNILCFSMGNQHNRNNNFVTGLSGAKQMVNNCILVDDEGR